jgi:osmotically-inducible protein OsmY
MQPRGERMGSFSSEMETRHFDERPFGSEAQRGYEGQRMLGGQRTMESQRFYEGQRSPYEGQRFYEGQRPYEGQRRYEEQRFYEGQRPPYEGQRFYEGQRPYEAQRGQEGMRTSEARRWNEVPRMYEGSRRYEGGRQQQGEHDPSGVLTPRDSEDLMRGARQTQERPFAGRGPRAYKRSDDRIREDIYESLCGGYFDATEVEVEVQDGMVKLGGFVADKQAKRLAEDFAEAVRGARNVENRITVRPQSSMGDPRSRMTGNGGQEEWNRRNQQNRSS